MSAHIGFPLVGGCVCGEVRYRMETPPLVVHACHCRWCQRETGSAFALNAMIEADRVALVNGAPDLVTTPSNSGKGQLIARCPTCRIAVWSNYAGSGPITRFVRVGTLDTPEALPPDVHIFTSSMQPWVVLPVGARSFPHYYRREAVWEAGSLERFAALQPAIAAWRATQ
jgi:hypothetical protein